MPRDTDKYRYITAAIPRDSQLHNELVADAAASGKSLADIMIVRLADYYRGTRSPQDCLTPRPGLLEERVHQRAPLPRSAATPLADVYQISSTPAPHQEEEIKEYDPKRAKSAAMVALANMDFGEE